MSDEDIEKMEQERGEIRYNWNEVDLKREAENYLNGYDLLIVMV